MFLSIFELNSSPNLPFCTNTCMLVRLMWYETHSQHWKSCQAINSVFPVKSEKCIVFPLGKAACREQEYCRGFCSIAAKINPDKIPTQTALGKWRQAGKWMKGSIWWVPPRAAGTQSEFLQEQQSLCRQHNRDTATPTEEKAKFGLKSSAGVDKFTLFMFSCLIWPCLAHLKWEWSHEIKWHFM